MIYAIEDGMLLAPRFAFLTSADHLSGTDRLEEVTKRLGFSDDEIIVNVLG